MGSPAIQQGRDGDLGPQQSIVITRSPHAIGVYASQPLSPVAPQHSLPSDATPYLGRTLAGWIAPALWLAHLLDYLVSTHEQRRRL
jgi:hypothetical protein